MATTKENVDVTPASVSVQMTNDKLDAELMKELVGGFSVNLFNGLKSLLDKTQQDAYKSENILKHLENASTPEEYTSLLLDVMVKKGNYCYLNYHPNIKSEMLYGNPVLQDNQYWLWRGSNFVDLVTKLGANFGDFTKLSYGNTLFQRTLPESKAPERSRITDAGFDLHLVKLIKEEHGLLYYTTGVVLEPPAGMWYMLVPRSSMAKSGYTMANGIGIIDAAYRGEIIVALRKVSPDVPEIVLPAKMVQVVPQQWLDTSMVEVENVSTTDRADKGGLGSVQFKNLPEEKSESEKSESETNTEE